MVASHTVPLESFPFQPGHPEPPAPRQSRGSAAAQGLAPAEASAPSAGPLLTLPGLSSVCGDTLPVSSVLSQIDKELPFRLISFSLVAKTGGRLSKLQNYETTRWKSSHLSSKASSFNLVFSAEGSFQP